MIMAWSLVAVEMKEALKSIPQYQYDHLGDVKHLKSFVREKKLIRMNKELFLYEQRKETELV